MSSSEYLIQSVPAWFVSLHFTGSYLTGSKAKQAADVVHTLLLLVFLLPAT
jgi:hypothetical protein